jgi:hypothetical protein
MPSGHFLKSNDNPFSGERDYNHKKGKFPALSILIGEEYEKNNNPTTKARFADGQSGRGKHRA